MFHNLKQNQVRVANGKCKTLRESKTSIILCALKTFLTEKTQSELYDNELTQSNTDKFPNFVPFIVRNHALCGFRLFSPASANWLELEIRI